MKSLTVVIAQEHMPLYRDAIKGLDLPAPVFGGKERNESVCSGLKSLSYIKDEETILIHDAARPFVEPAHIVRVAEAANISGAACLACPVADTLRREDGAYIERGGLWALQTPQGFRAGLLRRAHELAKPDKTVTDDTALVAALGHDIQMVPGSHRNIKITSPEDRILAEQLMDIHTETRIGTGFDVHAFSKDKRGSVRLCGIDIAHECGLEGHSDADVALHAITDALLGALALGDIGQHFPPSDIQWKDAASDKFLSHAAGLVRAQGGRIVNLDMTLICEAPKIGPHRRAMQEQVATICGIEPDRVSIKATTTEQLGFTGRREGIAAQACASVEVPRV
ncbi:MAG: 2-C-methyl-D-erythritol 2,4-cyclodiphosphate synthase [Terriglobia bacterium]